jgi:hypothetical protein
VSARHDVEIGALERFGRDLDSAMREHRGSARPGPRRGRLAAVVLAGAVVAAGLTATPPGRAIAERLGELAGIGDEPTSSLDSPVDVPDAVFGVGQAPNGTGYEVVANTDHNLVRDRVHETCVSVEFPSTGSGAAWANCLTRSLAASIADDPLHLAARFGPAELGAERLIISGIVSTEIAHAEIRYEAPDGDTSVYDAEVFPLSGEVGQAIGADEELHYALAFLPTDVAPPKPEDHYAPIEIGREHPMPSDPRDHPVNQALDRFTVVGFDESGREVDRQSLGSYTWAFLILYPLEHPGADSYERAFEECLRALAAERGGPIKPDLSEEEVDELDACARRGSE